MTTKTIEAWVLHKKWSGDTSARVTFFTCDLGIIDCLYKGGRTPKKQALLQAFTPVWLSVDKRYEQFFVKTIESISPTLSLDSHSLFSALYLNEILYYILTPQAPDEGLFNAYLFTLHQLSLIKDKLELEALLRRFEWTLLKSCGYSFSLTHEARGKEFIFKHLYYQFVPGEGFFLSTHGVLGEHILALSEDRLDKPEYLKLAKIMMRQAINHVLSGRKIKARDLYLG